MWLQLFSSLRRLYAESASTSLLPPSTIWSESLLLLVRPWIKLLAYCTIFRSIVLSIMHVVYIEVENTCTLYFMGSFFRHLCTMGSLPQALDGISSYGHVLCVRGPLFLAAEDVRQFYFSFLAASFIWIPWNLFKCHETLYISQKHI